MIKGEGEALNPEHVGKLGKGRWSPRGREEGVRKTQWDKQGGASFQRPIRSPGRQAADTGWAGGREPWEEAG